jgi:hypothetical protein
MSNFINHPLYVTNNIWDKLVLRCNNLVGYALATYALLPQNESIWSFSKFFYKAQFLLVTKKYET